ncbi:hypothetical protein ACFVL4_13750 [Bacillus subtilis]|uniref:Uncharacterized protein n=3 Tax=Bacteria TaxID=2 RepID=Q84BM5_BACIU|nr:MULTISPECIES: hypothetical protein [Bacillus]MCO6060468.1 hypothetical protein [Pseudomonas sp. MOB-449]AAM52333.1 unknown [Bacillus subtilis]APB62411.1 hypothetical protein pBS72_1420 [Bacillus subtilis]MEA1024829.1 hypothetical protein [Bacillus subtilis]MEC2297557.1 hypothetical protein [Bacillus subtilis]
MVRKLGDLPRKPQGDRSSLKNPYMDLTDSESKETTEVKQTEPKRKKALLKTMKVDVSIHNKIKSLHEILAASEGNSYYLEDTIERAIDKMVETLPESQKTFYEYELKKRTNKG